MNRALLGRWGRWLLLVGPASGLVVLELLHPNWDGTVYHGVAPVVDWWIPLHLMLLVLFALVALALLLSVADQQGPAAVTARVVLGLFVVGNSAFIGIDGIATGLLVRGAQGLPAAQQAGVEQALQALWDSPTNVALGSWAAGLSWVVAIGASALVFYPDARQRVPLTLLALSLLMAIGIKAGVSPDVPVPTAGGGLLGVAEVILGLAAIGLVVARAGAAAVPFGLLLVAAFLPQHGSPAGAVGVACLGLGLVWREFTAPRSAMRPAVLAPRAAAPVS